jgi:hypothetical protein
LDNIDDENREGRFPIYRGKKRGFTGVTIEFAMKLAFN